MRKKHALFGAIIGICAIVGCAGRVLADTITVHSLASDSPPGTYTYTVSLDAAADVEPGDGFVIYDFPALTTWSISGGLASSQFALVQTLTSNVLAQSATIDTEASTLASTYAIPFDSPGVENLSFVYTGPPAPFLGSATALLTLNTTDLLPPTVSMYGSVDHSGPLPSVPFSISTNAVLVPTPVPEPTSLALLGIGCAGLLARRRRISRR